MTKLDFVTLKNDNRMYASGFDSDLIYSPNEGLARDIKDQELVYPMKRSKNGWTEHVWFGFRSSVCLGPGKFGNYAFCPYSDDERFLVADMTCHSVLADEVLEQQ